MLVECCNDILALSAISNISRFQTEDGGKFWNRDINFTYRFEAKLSLFFDWLTQRVVLQNALMS